MIHPVSYFLLICAAISTFWAAVASAFGFDGEFKTAAVIAIVCLGVTQFLDYRNSEEERRKYLFECEREAVWARRDRECQADR